MKPAATRIVITAETPIEPAPTAATTLRDKREPIQHRIQRAGERRCRNQPQQIGSCQPLISLSASTSRDLKR